MNFMFNFLLKGTTTNMKVELTTRVTGVALLLVIQHNFGVLIKEKQLLCKRKPQISSSQEKKGGPFIIAGGN